MRRVGRNRRRRRQRREREQKEEKVDEGPSGRGKRKNNQEIKVTGRGGTCDRGGRRHQEKKRDMEERESMGWEM